MIERGDMEGATADTSDRKAHLVVIVVTALCAITCGITFLLALFHQFGLVEVAASLSAWVEVFFMSSAIGDLLEDRPHPNRRRFIGALILAAAIALYFVVMRIVSGRGA